MEKWKLLFVILIFSTSLSGQVSNGSFEDWEVIVVDTIEQPIGWSTNYNFGWFDSIPNVKRFERDTISVEGNYSLKSYKDESVWTYVFQCSSIASTSIKLQEELGEDKVLSFFIRSLSDNDFGSTFFRISGDVFDGNVYLGRYEWEHFEEILAFSKRAVDLPFPTADSLTIKIETASSNGPLDGCINESTTWIDKMEITESTLSNWNELRHLDLKIYPNPSNGKIFISDENDNFSSYSIYNLLGQKLEADEISGSSIYVKSKGHLLLRLENRNGEESASMRIFVWK